MYVALAVTLFALGFPNGPSSGEPFDVVFLDGKVKRADSLSIRQGEVQIGNGQSASVQTSWRELNSIRPIGVQGVAPKQLLRLVDGSEIAIKTIVGKGDLWSIETEQGRFEIGKKQASWLRFRQANSVEDSSWQSMIDSKNDSDLLVISRDEGLLDRAQGMIIEVKSDTVKFDYDGQVLDAPISKLLGIVWLRPQSNPIEPTVRIRTTDGSQWMARDLIWSTVNQSPLQFTTPLGMKVEVRPENLMEIDFSIANLKWLSGLPIVSLAATPRITTKQPIPGRNLAFQPRFVSRREGGSDQDKDLLFPSPGEITFRVPEQVARFESNVIRTSEGDVHSELILEIYENETLIQERKLAPDEDSITLSCDVHVDKRLKLVVRSNATLAAGSEVKWLQPRFLR